MHSFIAITLLILGLVLLFSVDTIIDNKTSNSTLRIVYDNKNIVGSACIAGAYYSYLTSQNELANFTNPESELEVPSEISHVGENLPSYDQSIGTSDILNL